MRAKKAEKKRPEKESASTRKSDRSQFAEIELRKKGQKGQEKGPFLPEEHELTLEFLDLRFQLILTSPF